MRWVPIGLAAAVAVLLLSLVSCVFEIVQPGTVGVVTHFGAVQEEILAEGLHVLNPVRTSVVPIDVRVQKLEDEATASSEDLQVVTSKVALNYYLEKTRANEIFQGLGPRYEETIIGPAVQESVKSSTAQFTAEELITRRPEVKRSIFENIRGRLERYHIVVTDFSILDFQFSPEFDRAIEEKQVAEQRALRARNDLQRVRIEAEQAKATAEGQASAQLALARAEAEAQKLLRRTLTRELIELRAVEKWDGVLPRVATGASVVPILELAEQPADRADGARAGRPSAP